MITLKGEYIQLRALEPEDLEFVLDIENDETLWHVSNTQVPFSKFIIRDYIANAHKDIYEVKQLRLVIEDKQQNPLGLIDIFDFDFKNKRAGVGVVIKDIANRTKGFGEEALRLLIAYSFKHLNLHQLYSNIAETNTASLGLFKKLGFLEVGLKKDWNYTNGVYNSEYTLQLINY
jgi:diamine N-acetyltransferase